MIVSARTCTNLSALIFVASILAPSGGTAKAGNHGTISAVENALRKPRRKREKDARRERLQHVVPYVARQSERHADKPHLVAELRLLLIPTLIELEDSAAAQRIAVMLIKDYHKAVGEERFTFWLRTKLRTITFRKQNDVLEVLKTAASQVGLALPAVLPWPAFRAPREEIDRRAHRGGLRLGTRRRTGRRPRPPRD